MQKLSQTPRFKYYEQRVRRMKSKEQKQGIAVGILIGAAIALVSAAIFSFILS